jgi:glycosyltransferase involved in cell wall biosynthesis
MAGRSRRIVVDGSMARNGGGFTYLVNIVPQLARLAPEHCFRLFVGSARIADAIPSAPNLEVDLLPEAGIPERLRFTYLEAPRRAAAWGAELYFSVGGYAPVSAKFPVIASFQNLAAFTEMGRDWPLRQRLRFRALNALARLSARSCDRILFVSEDSAQSIGEAIGIPLERRAVVHHGIDLESWGQKVPRASRSRPYILSVSSIYRYKNYVRLIEAYAALARRRPSLPDLVIVGDDQDPDYARRMEAARAATGALASRIHILGEVPYAEVCRYYAGASLFVMPSCLESFGLPLLEAMASEVPLVASDLPVFREIAADAAFYADPHSSESLAGAMEEALFLAGAREMLIKRGRERVREFTWDRSAEGLLNLFHQVIAERESRVYRRPVVPALDWSRRSGRPEFAFRSALQRGR